MSKKEFYFGAQKVLQETQLDNGFVQLVLENTINPELDGGEVITIGENFYKKVRTTKPIEDLSEARNHIREKGYDELIGQIAYLLYSHGVFVSDFDYIFQSLDQTFVQANKKRTNKLEGRTPERATFAELKDDLIKE